MRKSFLLILILVVFIGAGLQFIKDDVQPQSRESASAQTENAGQAVQPANREVNSPAAPEVTSSRPLDIQRCNELEYVHQSGRMALTIENGYNGFMSYVEQGFSVDDITLAIENEQMPFLAVEFRTRYFTQDAPAVLLLGEAHSRFNRYADLGSRRQSPPPWFNSQLQSEDEFSIPEGEQLLPDDLAGVIHRLNVSDERIMQAVASLPDPNARISMEWVVGYNLLLVDVAASVGRSDLALQMIDEGVQPYEDVFLGGTLDAAISGLMRLTAGGQQLPEAGSDTEDRVKRQLTLISRLVGMGLTLHASYSGDSRVLTSFSSTQSYRLTEELIENIYLQYGLDISAIPLSQPVTPGPRFDELTALMDKAESEIYKQHGVEFTADMRAQCQVMKTRIAEKWSPEEHLFRDDFADLTDEALFAKAPELTSCKKRMDAYDRMSNRESSELSLEKINEAIGKRDPDQLIRMISEHPDRAEELIDFMIASLPSSYSKLRDSGNLPAEIDYSTGSYAMRARELAEQGFDIQQTDRYGRSLLYGATSNWNPSLMSFLVEEGVPYYTLENGPDPLYLTIFQVASQNRNNQVTEMFDAVMSYHPIVETMHLQQMQVLKLKFPAVYDTITEKYPVLAIDGEPYSYPKSTCPL